MAFENTTSTADLSLPDFAHLDEQVREALRASPIAGGESYIRTLRDDEIRTRDDADVIVGSAEELQRAADDDSVDSIFVEGEIDVAGYTIEVYGTDLYSDRGIDGEPGALIYTDEKGHHTHAWSAGGATGQIHLHDGSALFGLRIRGGCLDWDAAGHPGYVPYPDGDPEERAVTYRENRGRAIKLHDSDCSVSNARIWGWGSSGIAVGSGSDEPVNAHIHHVDISDCMMTSAGYGVDIFRGYVDIEDSYFNATRHSICTFGYYDSGWTASNCLFGPSHSSHILDAHGLHNNVNERHLDNPNDPQSPDWINRASGRLRAEGCTFLCDHVIPDATFDGGLPTWAISIRGVPWPMTGEGIVIDRCAFVHDGPQEQNHGIRSFSDPAAVNQGPVPAQFQNDMGFSQNFIFGDNKYGISLFPEYDGRYGADIDLRNPVFVSREEPRLARVDPHAESRATALKDVEGGLQKLSNHER